MSKRGRRYISAAESAEIWDRWQRGEGLKLIGRAVLDAMAVAMPHYPLDESFTASLPAELEALWRNWIAAKAAGPI